MVLEADDDALGLDRSAQGLVLRALPPDNYGIGQHFISEFRQKDHQNSLETQTGEAYLVEADAQVEAATDPKERVLLEVRLPVMLLRLRER